MWEAAVQLRGNVAPADYEHFVLPLLLMRYLSLKYERRREVLKRATKDPQSEYYTSDPAIAKEILNDIDEYKREGIFIIPEKARWDYLVRQAQDDDIKLKLDHAMELLERTYPGSVPVTGEGIVASNFGSLTMQICYILLHDARCKSRLSCPEKPKESRIPVTGTLPLFGDTGTLPAEYRTLLMFNRVLAV